MSERLERLRALLSRLKKPSFCKFLKTDDGSMYEIKNKTITPITEQELAERDGLKIFLSFPSLEEYLKFTNSRLENLN